jgi:hypothetical protein
MTDLSEIRTFSMLDRAVLARLQKLAAEGSGGVLEVGAYIGGSTAALASGHRGSRKHAVMELGGQYLEHDTLPSGDIIGDWTRNVGGLGLLDHVRLFQGFSTDMRIFLPAMGYLGDIGLFFFDADGRVADQFAVLAPYLRPDCAVVLDDYMVEPQYHQVKADLVRPWVRQMVDAGVLIETDVIDGTWFGRLGRWTPDVFRFHRRESGHAFISPVAELPDETTVRVFEDGRELGPAQVTHDQVRETGMGASSHWLFGDGPRMFWSTSDNSDPNTNGRRYEFRKV